MLVIILKIMISNKQRIPGLYHIVNTQKQPGMVVAEIGCFEGETTLQYIDIVRQMKGHVYVLDWMCGSETGTFNPKENSHGFKSQQKDRDGQRQRLEKNLKEYIDIGMVTILDGPSGDLINLIPNRSLDVCFIDADHRYHSVYRDIDLCIHKVKFGGVLCGHDCELFLPIEFLGPKIPTKYCTRDHPDNAPITDFISIKEIENKTNIPSEHLAVGFENSANPEIMHQKLIKDLWIHAGVIRAVWDQFGKMATIINPKIDPLGVWYIEINNQTIEKWINQKSVVEN
jgi:hypothetical protein